MNRASGSSSHVLEWFETEGKPYTWNTNDLPIETKKKKKLEKGRGALMCAFPVPNHGLTLDLAAPDRKGISLASSLLECINVANERAVHFFRRTPPSEQHIPTNMEYVQYLYRVPRDTQMHPSLVIIRDDPYVDTTAAPTGHHTLSSMCGGSHRVGLRDGTSPKVRQIGLSKHDTLLGEADL